MIGIFTTRSLFIQEHDVYFCGGFTCQPCHAFQNLLPCVIPGWSSLNGKFVWDLQGRCRSELWSLKFVMDRGDQRQMQRCKWVPVNSDFSLFSVLLFFLTLALLSKIKPIPPTDIWLWFHNVGSYGEAMVFLGWYTSLPPPFFFLPLLTAATPYFLILLKALTFLSGPGASGELVTFLWS